MKLTSDLPYWAVQNGLIRSYPALDRDLTCECVIVGAGITCAMLADRFCRDGIETVVLDGRDICTGWAGVHRFEC